MQDSFYRVSCQPDILTWRFNKYLKYKYNYLLFVKNLWSLWDQLLMSRIFSQTHPFTHSKCNTFYFSNVPCFHLFYHSLSFTVWVSLPDNYNQLFFLLFPEIYPTWIILNTDLIKPFSWKTSAIYSTHKRLHIHTYAKLLSQVQMPLTFDLHLIFTILWRLLTTEAHTWIMVWLPQLSLLSLLNPICTFA